MFLWTLLILIGVGLLVFALVVAGLVSAQAATNIKEYGYEEDPDLKNVHALAAGVASVALIVAIVTVGGGIYLAFFSGGDDDEDDKGSGSSILLYGVTAALTLGLLAAGGMAAYAASEAGVWIENNQAEDDGLVDKAKTNLVWASVLSFLSIGGLIIVVVFNYFKGRSEDKKDDKKD